MDRSDISVSPLSSPHRRKLKFIPGERVSCHHTARDIFSWQHFDSSRIQAKTRCSLPEDIRKLGEVRLGQVRAVGLPHALRPKED